MNANEILASGSEMYFKCLMDLKGHNAEHAYDQLLTKNVVNNNDNLNTVTSSSMQSIYSTQLYKNPSFGIGFTGFGSMPVASFTPNVLYTQPVVYGEPKIPYFYSTTNMPYDPNGSYDEPSMTPSFPMVFHSPPSAPAVAHASSFTPYTDRSAVHHARVDSNENAIRSKKSKKTTAANGTKRPMNAFMVFAKRHRQDAQVRYPNFDNRTISKILSEWWYAFERADPDCKRQYTKFAKELKAEHDRAHPKYKWKTSQSTASNQNNGPVHLIGNVSKQLQQMDTSGQKMASTQMEVCRRGRQQKQMLAKAPASTAPQMGTNVSNRSKFAFNERFHTLPKFDHGSYNSPTQWPSYNTKRGVTASSELQIPRKKQYIKKMSFGPNAIEANVIDGAPCYSKKPSAVAFVPTDANGNQQSNRKILERRKKVIMSMFDKSGMYPPPNEIEDVLKNHGDLFQGIPFLNLKIRSIRQKYMNNNLSK